MSPQPPTNLPTDISQPIEETPPADRKSAAASPLFRIGVSSETLIRAAHRGKTSPRESSPHIGHLARLPEGIAPTPKFFCQSPSTSCVTRDIFAHMQTAYLSQVLRTGRAVTAAIALGVVLAASGPLRADPGVGMAPILVAAEHPADRSPHCSRGYRGARKAASLLQRRR